MRKFATIGVAVLGVPALGAGAVAIAQTTEPAEVKVTAKVSPKSGGSAKKPKLASTNIKFTVNQGSKSTLAGIRYGIPRSIKISGAGFPKCSATTINNEGEGACPKGSKVGTGASTAFAGAARIEFSVNVYANGAKGLTLALQQVGGELNVPFDAKISRRSISFDIPDNVQQPVPGLYSFVTSVTAILPKKSIRKNGKTYRLVSRVGCFGGRDRVKITLPLSDNPNPPAKNPITGSASSKCSK